MRPTRSTRSMVWNYFQRSDDKNHAVCDLCDKRIKIYGGTTNLMQHLFRIHGKDQLDDEISPIKNEPVNQDMEQELEHSENVVVIERVIDPSSSETSRWKKRSVVWNYFCKSDDNKNEADSKARCNLCNKIIKSFGGTTNLRQHLLRKHPETNITETFDYKLPAESDEQLIYDNEFQNIEEQYTISENVVILEPSKDISSGPDGSIVWNYFCKSDYDQKDAVCNLCNKSIKCFGSTVKLRQHLSKFHRQIHQKEKLDGEIILSIEADDEQDQIMEKGPGPSSVTPNPGRKSTVWNYFSKNEDKKYVECSLCNKNMKWFGNTTNLRQHLLRIHKGIHLTESITTQLETKPDEGNEHEYQQVDQNIGEHCYTVSCANTSTSHSEKVSPEYFNGKFEKSQESLRETKNALPKSKIDKINSKLLEMITKDYQPLSLVENIGFLEYSHELQPLYKPPSKIQLTSEILPKHYRMAVSLLKSIFSIVRYCAISMDIWTSESNRDYLTVTSHFIHNNKIHARVLSTEEIFGSHITTENIAGHLTKVTDDWSITGKIVTTVSKIGAILKCDIDDFQDHHPCVSHMLCLSVSEALFSIDEINAFFDKCRALVGFFKHSVEASKEIESVQEQMSLPFLKLKQDADSKWDSCFMMINRLVQIKDPLCIAVTNLQDVPEFLDEDEWKILHDILEVLKPANNLTTKLSSEKYPAISLIIPLIRGFQFQLKFMKTNTDVGNKLRTTLLESVTHRLGGFETDKIVAKACFMDPRFKKVAFGMEENANNAQKWVIEELEGLLSANKSVLCEPMQTDQDQEQDRSSDDEIWSHFDKKLSKTCESETPSDVAELIIRQYLEMPMVIRSGDPLEFWAKHKVIFPELYELATKYLCVPATSMPSADKKGQLAETKKSRLEPDENLDQIVFLNSQY